MAQSPALAVAAVAENFWRRAIDQEYAHGRLARPPFWRGYVRVPNSRRPRFVAVSIGVQRVVYEPRQSALVVQWRKGRVGAAHLCRAGAPREDPHNSPCCYTRHSCVGLHIKRMLLRSRAGCFSPWPDCFRLVTARPCSAVTRPFGAQSGAILCRTYSREGRWPRTS